jgi:hypothetical protein
MTDATPARGDSFSASFETFAGWSAAGAALAGAGYAVAFVVLKDELLSGLTLLLAPLLAIPPLIAVYGRLRSIDAGFAVLGLSLGLFGSMGAAIHGGFDLANALHEPGGIGEFPNYVDPRGLLTFGASGLALILLAWLAGRSPDLPRWISPLGMLLGAVLVLTWLGRLIVLTATSPLVLGPALVAGILSPIFYLLLARWFLGRGS